MTDKVKLGYRLILRAHLLGVSVGRIRWASRTMRWREKNYVNRIREIGA